MTHIRFNSCSLSRRLLKQRLSVQHNYQHSHFKIISTCEALLANKTQPGRLLSKLFSTNKPVFSRLKVKPPQRKQRSARLLRKVFTVESTRYRILRRQTCCILFSPGKRQRVLRREQVVSPTPASRKMRSYVEFLTTPTADTPGTTLLLHFDNKRYLIGSVSEGTQRASIETGLKLGKVSDIFLTGRIEWKNTGGLLGMILTLADATGAREDAVRKAAIENMAKKNGLTSTPEGIASTKPSLVIHGGRNLTHTLATARRFVFRTSMPVEADEVTDTDNGARLEAEDWSPTSSDENIKVWAMAIPPLSTVTDISESASVRLPGSSRKRSFEMIDEDQMEPEDNKSQESRVLNQHTDDQVRKAVVSDMFNSEWRLDHLVEQNLSEVKMPADLFTRNPVTRHIERYSGPLPGHTTPSAEPDGRANDIRVLVREPWPGSKIDKLPPTTPSQEALSYIIKNHPQRGKFQPAVAIAKGIEPGPKFRALSMGENVQAADGSIVTPEMVMGKDREGGGLAVVELPSVDYIQGLLDRWEWGNAEVMKGVGAIVWILGPGVGNDERLKTFITERNHLEHIVSSPDYCPNYLAFHSSASLTIQLYQLDPLRYRLPLFDNSKVPQGENVASNVHGISTLFEPAARGQRIQLEPAVTVQNRPGAVMLNGGEVWRETPQETLLLAQKIRNDLRDADTDPQQGVGQTDLPSRNAEVITLGTGSALPSKYRNVSATLLRVPGRGSYLFDCGENTLGQLRRMFSAAEVSEILHDLKVIWISHLHADHHLGTTSLIKAWYQEVWGGVHLERGPSNDLHQARLKSIVEDKRLFVISDRSMISWLDEYAAVEDYGYSRIVPLSITPANPSIRRESTLQWDRIEFVSKPEASGSENSTIPLQRVPNTELMQAMGISDIQAVHVIHCKGAKAVAVTFPDGFKFSYSGDCRPSKAFIAIGKGSTVLLHEATFDDELLGDAVAKKHSTTSEALAVGAAMGARRVLLTHFSQRYQKVPVMDAMKVQDLRIETADVDEPSSTFRHDQQIGTHPLADAATEQLGVVEPASSADVAVGGDKDGFVKIKPPSSIDMKFGLAFDFMRVKVGQISHLEKLTPLLLTLFQTIEAESGAQSEPAAVTPVEKEGKAQKKNGGKRSDQKRGTEDKKIS